MGADGQGGAPRPCHGLSSWQRAPAREASRWLGEGQPHGTKACQGAAALPRAAGPTPPQPSSRAVSSLPCAAPGRQARLPTPLALGLEHLPAALLSPRRCPLPAATLPAEPGCCCVATRPLVPSCSAPRARERRQVTCQAVPGPRALPWAAGTGSRDSHCPGAAAGRPARALLCWEAPSPPPQRHSRIPLPLSTSTLTPVQPQSRLPPPLLPKPGAPPPHPAKPGPGSGQSQGCPPPPRQSLAAAQRCWSRGESSRAAGWRGPVLADSAAC